jgi:hypothetical protein
MEVKVSNQPVIYGTGPEKNKAASRSPTRWNPKELSPQMLRIMDHQLMNPGIKVKEIAQIVGWSPSRIKRIIGSDMYRQRYKERRLDIEKLQHSKIARERAKFLELRDKMIKEHLDLIKLDPKTYAGKELEAQKLRQKSVQDLLRVSNEQLKSAGDNGGTDNLEERTRSIEVSGDENESYMRIMETWRKGTK